MAESEVTIKVDDAEFQARLRNILFQLGSQSSGLMRAIGYYMRKRTVQHFTDEEDPEGNAWEPLKAATIAARRVGPRAKKRGGSRVIKILQDSGWLRNHIESLSDNTSAEIGTNVFYGIFHQGEDPDAYYSAPRAHIPRRAFLGISDGDLGGIHDLAWAYLVRVTNG